MLDRIYMQADNHISYVTWKTLIPFLIKYFE